MGTNTCGDVGICGIFLYLILNFAVNLTLL